MPRRGHLVSPNPLHAAAPLLMPSPSQETQLALMSAEIKQLKEHQGEQDKRIENMETERDKALKWGIGALGAMVLGMLGWIGSFAKDHIK